MTDHDKTLIEYAKAKLIGQEIYGIDEVAAEVLRLDREQRKPAATPEEAARAISQAFDMLGGIDGASEARDKLLEAMKAMGCQPEVDRATYWTREALAVLSGAGGPSYHEAHAESYRRGNLDGHYNVVNTIPVIRAAMAEAAAGAKVYVPEEVQAWAQGVRSEGWSIAGVTCDTVAKFILKLRDKQDDTQ